MIPPCNAAASSNQEASLESKYSRPFNQFGPFNRLPWGAAGPPLQGLPPSHTRPPRSTADPRDAASSAIYARIHAAGNTQRRAVLIRSRRRRGRASAGGTSSPSALAVLRSIAVSYLVGACTGRSAGLAPCSAVQDAVDIGCDLPILMQDVCAAGHETTGHDKRTVRINWQLVPSNRCACRGNTGAEVPGKVWG